MTLKTSMYSQPHLTSQLDVDRWWAKKPPVRIRAVRAFQMVVRNSHEITERYQVPPGVVLDVNPLMAQELVDSSKAEIVNHLTPLTDRQPGADPFGWEEHCKRVAAERASHQAPHGAQAILAALAHAVNQPQVRK